METKRRTEEPKYKRKEKNVKWRIDSNKSIAMNDKDKISPSMSLKEEQPIDLGHSGSLNVQKKKEAFCFDVRQVQEHKITGTYTHTRVCDVQ